MNYPKSTRNKIDKYLNAVRSHMQEATEEEVDEVILHLQEQIDVALEESGDAAEDPEEVSRILSAMSHPESFAPLKNEQSKTRRLGVVAVLSAVISWAFNLGAIPWFSLYGVVWFLLVALAAVCAVISRKTVPGKVAIGILILEVVSYPILHGLVME